METNANTNTTANANANTNELKIYRMSLGEITDELARIAKVMKDSFDAAREEITHCSKKEKPSAETVRRLAAANATYKMSAMVMNEIYFTFGIEV